MRWYYSKAIKFQWYTLNKLQRSHVHHGNYSYQYCTAYLYDMNCFSPYMWAKSSTALRDFWPPNVNEGSQKGAQFLQSCGCCKLPMVIAEELGEGMQEAAISHAATPYSHRKQDLASDTWGAYERNEFSEPREPRGLHLPIHRITVSSLAWYLDFLFFFFFFIYFY